MSSPVLDKVERVVTGAGALATLLRVRGELNDKTGQYDRVTALWVLPVWRRKDGKAYLFGIRVA